MNGIKRITLSLLGTAAGLSAVIGTTNPASAMNLVTNGSFEDPQLAANSWDVFTSIPGWSLAPGSDPRGFEVQNQAGGTAFEGFQKVELDAWGTTGIVQELATEVGKEYKLEFAFSARPDRPREENLLKIMWGGTVVDNLEADGTGLTDTNWTVYSYDLVATDTRTRLQFDNFGSPSNYFGTYIDAVSVTQVPEPTSVLALLAVGTLGAGLLKRQGK